MAPTTEEPFKIENVEGGVRLHSAAFKVLVRNELAERDRKTFKVEMFLKARNQAAN